MPLHKFASLTRAGRALLLAVLFCGLPGHAAAELIEESESLYNNIYVYRNEGRIALTFGHNRRLYTESIYNPADARELPVDYTRYMTVGLAYLGGPPQSIAEIGFGGGRTASYLHLFMPAVPITTVELDGEVVRLAKKYFGVREDKNFRIVEQDGRRFLSASRQAFDLLMIDAYRGPFVPFHLLTREFYEIVRQRMKPGGVMVLNIEPTTMLYDSAVKTIQSVFPNVDVYPVAGNVVLVAYSGAAKTAALLGQRAAGLQETYRFRYELPGLLQARRTIEAGQPTLAPDAKVLVDDFAPVEALKAIKKHNRKW